MSLIDVLSHTPLWVYILFIILLSRGIKALQDRVVHIKRLLFLPAVLLLLNIHHFVNYKHGMFYVRFYLAGMLIGLMVGFYLVRRLKVEKAKTPYYLEIAGSWQTLVSILIIFTVEYAVGFVRGADLPLVHNLWFNYMTILVSSLITGMFLMRAGFYVKKIIS